MSGSQSAGWNLRAISESTGQVLWTTPMGTLSRVNAPAVSNGKVYVTSTGHADTYFWTVVNGTAFEARSPATGTLLWSWTATENFSTTADATSPVVVVGNHAFVGTVNTTHAIDLTTHQSVWSYPGRGPMAVSANGVLYISTPGSLVAINLQ